MTDVVVRGRRVVTGGAVRPAALFISQGKITDIAPVDAVAPIGARDIDAADLVVAPGIIDAHVHINEPGRTEWEGFFTATQAAAAGGITTVVDMPLNCIPATTNKDAAEKKRDVLMTQQFVNVAFWGGVVPHNVDDLAGLAAFGVPGCKCFTCPSGVDEFPHVTESDLDRALPVLRDVGRTLLVHAEMPGPLDDAERATARLDKRLYSTFLASRPKAAEDDAIAMIIRLCERHNARAHIVHLSSSTALPMLRAAQKRGVQISAETCLHYLSLCAEDIEDGQTHFKCAPPIRERENQRLLWEAVMDGTIATIVSDHSPCTPHQKHLDTGDFMAAWGGISSLQLGLSVLWTQMKQRLPPDAALLHMLDKNSAAPARMLGLAGKKGALEVGHDADIAIFDDAATFVVRGDDLRHKHKLTPYAGHTLHGVVDKTIIGGCVVYDRKSGVVSRPMGSFVSVL
jgi:allantoinase